MAKKYTRVEIIGAVINDIVNSGVAEIGESQIPVDVVIDGLNKIIEAAAKKSAAAKAKAEEKKAAGDALKGRVFELITDEFQTVDDICVNFADDEEITKSKVVARLTQLVNSGSVVKEQVKIEGVSGKKIAYKLA